ncbi:hypothetical protein Tco_1263879 [Tanacetum coccineum]
MGKSTETLRLLTNEQRAYRDNIRKSGLGYKGPCVNSQANANIPKLYDAYELRDKNKNLQDKIERFSKESKDVLKESKTVHTFCNDAFDVTEEM